MVNREFDRSIRYDSSAARPDERQVEPAGGRPAEKDFTPVLKKREPYLASAELEDAVNIAIGLGRPLLLQGEPGSGKTRLAHAVAYAFGMPLEEAHVKSTSRGQDLLYTYDMMGRLNDVRLGRERDPSSYLTLGPLGTAIVRAEFGRRSVVLIDEIDKADLDFPNDLLRELDELTFTVPAEMGGGRHTALDRPELRPIVIITHNEEKTLPDAFLRRCIYHYIAFPSARQLDDILALHDLATPEVRQAGIALVEDLRRRQLAKNPGLSELMDWVRYTQERGQPTDTAASVVPHAGALIKLRADQQRVARGRAGEHRPVSG
ncbi:MoxR family ATPase [Dactylosporangium roseum]|uniref:MoxR family ATPase n=1 Tax=Dactylosporangium roseum TaxID=47989 RepID=A0ABY5Z025_9ACTN|nr:MoxR family ATPase [Dactylosporangium roseum]UWZ34143.1 MoxR family ATPase [Dactylosporangium roseum]